MLIGIISDTHDQMDNVRKAAEIFYERGVDKVFHAGDIGSPSVVKLFAGLDASFVFGNNDGERLAIPIRVKQIGGALGVEVLVRECDEGKIVVYHGTVPTILNALIRCGDYRVVITGHTHKIVNRLEGNTRVLNPGTGHGFGGPATIMIYDSVKDEAEVIEL
ncbi:MAG: YfcE family phosphodiesterase [Magnetococcales bacterium]|nr:YfcE family phosphodiesterase [Magnetococcales bacterium]